MLDLLVDPRGIVLTDEHGHSESKRENAHIVRELRKCGAEGVIRGCTETFLLIAQDDLTDFPVFDATKLHVQAAVETALS